MTTFANARWYTAACCIFLTVLIFFEYKKDSFTYICQTLKAKNVGKDENVLDYLVYSPQCQIPDLPMYDDEIRKMIKKKKLRTCPIPAYTYAEKSENSYKLYKRERASNLNCSYRSLHRGNNDDSVIYSNWTLVNEDTELVDEFIIVQCHNGSVKVKNAAMSDAYSVIIPRKDVLEKNKQLIKAKMKKGTKRKLSVLFVGIDSISRINLARSMPKTDALTKKDGWIDMLGYNKMADNTYPNLMAIFTGLNSSQAYSKCHPTQRGKLDRCNFIWKDYENAGYVTAYAEDEASFSTFNYRKKGFATIPTHHYLRPFIVAIQKHLKATWDRNMHECIGPITMAERVMRYASDFAKTYAKNPYFGIFWMNSFSHDDVNSPSKMDSKVAGFLQGLESDGVLTDSLVIFISDHGMRFGAIRSTMLGWFEERLPYLRIWVPTWYRKANPSVYDSLVANQRRLTTPYDLHMMLQDILLRSGDLENLTPPKGCPECGSLLEEVSANRSCADAGIQPHWCTCISFKAVAPTDRHVTKAATHIVGEIMKMVRKSNDTNTEHCAELELTNVDRAMEAVNSDGKTSYLLVQLTTKPGQGKFEATVRLLKGGPPILEGSISRINAYYNQSLCVDNAILRKYCFCI